MKKNKLCAAVLAAFIGLGITAGAPCANAAPADGMEAFRSAYFAKIKENDNMLARMILYGPSFHADTTFKVALASNGSFTASGNLNWVYTNLSIGKTARETIPLYINCQKDVLSLYGNRGTWLREDFAGAPLWILQAVVTNNIRELADNAEAVQSVELQQKTPGNHQALRITLDGRKLADLARKYSSAQSNVPDDSLQFAEYLAQGLEQTNPVVSWVVDEKTKETVTAYIDLTSVMQKYAQSLLEGNYQGNVALDDEDKSFLTTIGYYCNLQLYISHSKTDPLEPVFPKEAKGAVLTGKLLDDLESEAVASSLGN